MATVILVRHGRTTANVAGILAGRAIGVQLDDVGQEQAKRTAERLAAVSFVGVVSSPLERCRQTARLILDHQSPTLTGTAEAGETAAAANATGTHNPLHAVDAVEDDITECDYGQWQGLALSELVKEPLWSVVQGRPSEVVFPGGESMQAMQSRAVAAIRRLDAKFEAEHGPNAVWVAVSHGDVIKSILADALGMHLDHFQRISVNPASVSIVRYRSEQPHVAAMNTDAGDLSWLRTVAAEPQLGGGAGHQAAGHQAAATSGS
ncbi:MAG: MSMEG_4193 family putative phosphomutase [Microbacteriaceae bacterium]|nr:MSMEG_4193 family putative phosphomutase [Microbacteriaceae bacterium]